MWGVQTFPQVSGTEGKGAISSSEVVGWLLMPLPVEVRDARPE